MSVALEPPTVRVQGGPPLWAPIAAYVLLAVAGAVLYPGAGPGSSPATALAVLRDAPVRADVAAALLVMSAAPLAVFAAAAAQRLWALGARVAGPVIGLVGGLLAPSALVLSGLAAWTAATAAQWGDGAVVLTASTLSFAAGGVGFALGSALLLAGLAVPAGLMRLLPRPLAVAGVVVAVLAALAPLSLITSALYALLPIARFGGMLWFVAAAVLLPRVVPARAA
ncbi:DUF4386 domain-containing protein [Pseudonocardia endophytica]|uniref:DUF4386 family protein n=1 Tax=Pseudonocardia endophytica TaxID=401976 RepID=A0A4R1HCT8_PSEEN|nr:DUF4386 domain-containing protein [Pseudonocardia endophytica]TCK19847.1 hypothetical protein EV378_3790 [Pseudonocardia endophytica]